MRARKPVLLGRNVNRRDFLNFVSVGGLVCATFSPSWSPIHLYNISPRVIIFSSHRLCEKDPFQLYQRLEQQAREYVLEMKARLLKHLSPGPTVTGPAGTVAAAHGPPQAYQFISMLLEEYSALCQAARTISSFLLTLVSWSLGQQSVLCIPAVSFVQVALKRIQNLYFLTWPCSSTVVFPQENEHLQKFQVTWELHNKHLFENLVFSEPILHSSLPALVAQLK